MRPRTDRPAVTRRNQRRHPPPALFGEFPPAGVNAARRHARRAVQHEGHPFSPDRMTRAVRTEADAPQSATAIHARKRQHTAGRTCAPRRCARFQ
ncbi:hypothetical protein F01_440075 [Burkholderia cenocepacia]|nr:hypothetical protein F01_440075 [Burkholderia cenocepacia]